MGVRRYVHPYYSREGTLRIGLSATGFMVVKVGDDKWWVTYSAMFQEPECLGEFSTEEEAKQFGITTFNLKGG